MSIAVTEDAFAELPGLVIEEVVPDSPAAKAGLKPGDIVLTCDDKALSSPAAFEAAQQNTFDKKQVILRVRRGEKTVTLAVPVGSLGISARPELSHGALTLYLDGKTTRQEQRADETISRWTGAARTAHKDSDKSAAAWLYARVGEIREEQRQWKEANEMHAAAWELLKEGSDSAAQSRTLSALGSCTKTLNDFAAAQRWFEQALQVDVAAGRRRWVADDLTNLGRLAYSCGDEQAAHDYHSRALVMYELLAPDSLQVAMSLNNLGAAAYLRGDIQAVQQYCKRALAIAEPLSADSLVVALSRNNLGLVAYCLGDLHAAHDYYNRALAIRERLAPNSWDHAMSLYNLGGIARDRGDLQSAQDYYSRALAIREQLAPNSRSAAGNLHGLGDVARDRGDLKTADEYYRRALAIHQRFWPDSVSVANSLHSMGGLAEDRGDFDAARDYHSQALAIRERVSPNSVDVAESLKNLGYVALKTGRLSDALPLFVRSVAIVDAQRRRLVSPEARALFLTHHSKPYTGLLRTHLALDDLPAAFAVFERARARSLVELLAEGKLNFRADAPAELLRQQDELDEKRATTYASLAKLDPKENAAQIEQLQRELTRYFAQQRELEEKIRLASPKFAALHYPEPLDLKEAQAALDSDSLLLAYHVDEEQTYLFAVTKTEIRVFTLPLGEKALNKQTKAFRNQVAVKRLGQRDLSSIEASVDQAEKLYDALIRPAQELVNQAQRILICSDGPLHTLPFAALVSRTQPGPRHFIEDKPLHTIDSMTAYAETRDRASRNRELETRLLAFGHPVYTKQQAESRKGQKPMRIPSDRGESRQEGDTDEEMAYLRSRGLTFDALPWSRNEVKGIGRLFGRSATIKMDRGATETTARQQSKDYTILHFAVHGWLDDQIGLASGLALSQPDVLGRQVTKEDNGLLQAWEIFEQMRVNADLVVLSACETGLGQRIRGEGLIGLTRAFQYAGAKSIVVSLWKVNDASTAELMKSFYRELRNGTSKDVALQKAMITVANNPKWRHPFYWSPFTLVGDWK